MQVFPSNFVQPEKADTFFNLVIFREMFCPYTCDESHVGGVEDFAFVAADLLDFIRSPQEATSGPLEFDVFGVNISQHHRGSYPLL